MRYFKILLIIVALTLFAGCTPSYDETSNKIARPENKEIPLQGKWIVEQPTGTVTEKSPTDADNKWTGKVFDFNGNSISFDGTDWSNVNYKIRRVNADEYFLHSFTDAIKSLEIKDKEIQVITASSQDKYLYEFIKLDSDRLVVNIDSKFYCLVKAPKGYSASVGKNKSTDNANLNISNNNVKNTVYSGLLLGIRIPEQMPQKGTDEKLEQYVYKTYWISYIDGKLGNLLWADDIFLPRKDGFWKLGVQKILGEKGIEDIITTNRVSERNQKKPALEAEAVKTSLRMETKMRRTILYVGNDYICTENIENTKIPDSSATGSKKLLRTMPVDNVNNTDGIKFSDLAGDNGSIAMEGAISGLLSNSNNNSIKNIIEDNQEENFALYRKMGHWFFKGRLSLATDEPVSYLEFNINLIPPADMVAYDILHVPWELVKDKVPQAVDAYTSPNSDMAVVLTRNSVMIYSIKDKTLEGDPVYKFSIPDGSAVVMAEWATGDYVLNWEKSFTRYNKAKPLEEGE
jgi:hypothetical protein